MEYEDARGSVPFRAWIDSLKDVRVKAKIDARLLRLRLGNFGDAKPVGDGVCELRIDHGPGYRIYYGLDGARLVVLLAGGDKASQRADITKAKTYWASYRGR
ncbi:MAG: type II toxin-antitoxin system RelE/ParE family toxin [Deltaproteobacteria bacterium]|nr:type II toxin-antitoxin system RelE/ParE family toxin [Deltaproteobacteria bacterium]